MSFKKLTSDELAKLNEAELKKYNEELAVYDNTPIGISKDELNRLKTLHRNVQCIIVEDFDGTLRAGYFRRPNIAELKAAKSNMEKDELDAAFTLFNSCKLWIDPVVDTDDFLKLSMIGQMGSIMKLQNSYIKNF